MKINFYFALAPSSHTYNRILCELHFCSIITLLYLQHAAPGLYRILYTSTYLFTLCQVFGGRISKFDARAAALWSRLECGGQVCQRIPES